MRVVDNLTLGVGLLIAFTIFVPLAMVLPRQEMFEVVDLLLVAVGLGTAVGFHPAAWDAIKLPVHNVTPAQVLVVALVIGSIAIACAFGAQWYWRVMAKPDAIIDSTVVAFSRWLIFIAWGMALLASGAHGDRLPTSTYKRAGVYVACATVVFGLLLTFGIS